MAAGSIGDLSEVISRTCKVDVETCAPPVLQESQSKVDDPAEDINRGDRQDKCEGVSFCKVHVILSVGSFLIITCQIPVGRL